MRDNTCLRACPCPGEEAGASCGGCGACCAARLPLSAEERQLLERFAVIPFLPVVFGSEERRILLLESGLPPEKAGLALSLLLRRGYADVDLQAPLKQYPYGTRPGDLAGSAALTARGQDALDELEFGGPDPERR